MKQQKRTVTLGDVRKALERSPFPRQRDELVPLVFICEELAARPLLRAERPVVDVNALEGEDLDAIQYASDTASFGDAPRAVREALQKIAIKQRKVKP